MSKHHHSHHSLSHTSSGKRLLIPLSAPTPPAATSVTSSPYSILQTISQNAIPADRGRPVISATQETTTNASVTKVDAGGIHVVRATYSQEIKQTALIGFDQGLSDEKSTHICTIFSDPHGTEFTVVRTGFYHLDFQAMLICSDSDITLSFDVHTPHKDFCSRKFKQGWLDLRHHTIVRIKEGESIKVRITGDCIVEEGAQLIIVKELL